MNMKRVLPALFPTCLMLVLSLSALPISGCGSSGNTVVEPDDGMMDEQEMQDYNKQMAEQEANYNDRYK